MPKVKKPLAPLPWAVRWEGGSINTLRGADGKSFGRVEGTLNAARMERLLNAEGELVRVLGEALESVPHSTGLSSNCLKCKIDILHQTILTNEG